MAYLLPSQALNILRVQGRQNDFPSTTSEQTQVLERASMKIESIPFEKEYDSRPRFLNGKSKYAL